MRSTPMEQDRLHEVVKDPEGERVTAFMEQLSAIQAIKPIVPDIEFSQEEPVRYAQNRFLAYEHDDIPTLFINPTVVEQTIEDSTELPISFDPLVARGGKRSAHGVFFGTLQLGEQEVPVAVKPHTANATETCLNDYFNLIAIEQLGTYSLMPAGILMAEKDGEQAYSMTVLQEGLTTLDSIDWSTYFPNMTRNPGMSDMWRKISDQMAVLHGDGNKSHGDMAARNIATSSDGGVFFIDWELANIRSGTARDAEVRYGYSYTDLSVLLESMCLPPHANIGGKAGIGIFYGKSGDWWQGFRDIFFDEYEQVRIALAEQGNHHSQILRDVEEELSVLKLSLQEDIKMFQEICAEIPSVEEIA